MSPNFRVQTSISPEPAGLRLIIGVRDATMANSHLEGKAAASLPGDRFRHPGAFGSDFPHGSGGFSDARLDRPECVRIGDGEPLLRRASEKWQDVVDLRSGAAVDLRACSVSAQRIHALLVSGEASRAADRYLAARKPFGVLITPGVAGKTVEIMPSSSDRMLRRWNGLGR